MSLQEVKSRLGDYAKDIKLNLGSVLTEEGAPGLSQKQIDGIALASAYATRHDVLVRALEGEVSGRLTEAEIASAKAAATIMAMNNVYYRFVHLASDQEYRRMRANLRMNVIGSPGIEKVDFELMSLAVSAINGCGMCIDAHINEVSKAGIPKEGIQSAARIAAVINAAAQALTLN